MKKTIFKRSLSRDLVSALTLAVLAVCLLLALVIYRYNITNVEQKIREISKENSENLATILREPLWNLQHSEIDRVITLYLEKELINSIEVKSPFYHKIVHKDELAHEELLIVEKKVIYSNQEIGLIKISYTKVPFYASITQLVLMILITLVTVLILIILITGYLVQRILVNPLGNLIKSVNEIAKGTYTTRMPFVKQNDVNLLISSFNEMFRQLEERDRELSVHHDEIKNLQQYLQNIIHSMPSAIIVTDECHQIKQFNSAAQVLIGNGNDDFGNGMSWFAIPELKRFRFAYDEVIKSKRPRTFPKEFFPKFEGHFFSVTIFPLSYGVHRGMVFRIDDITEIEKIEEQLRQTQKMETVGNLAGGLAHDFNNVLAGIVGTTSIIKFKLSRNTTITTDDLKDNLELIEHSGQRASEMVQQLLTLSRKAEMTMTSIDLNSALKHIYKICKNTFDKSIDLQFEYSKEQALIKADPMQIEQVVLNLCINSAHAMTIMRPNNDKQGGTLSLKVEQISVDEDFCSIHHEAHIGLYWCLKVEDTGVGICKDVLNKMFDPFFTTKPSGKGTGLGLSMVYSIISQHGGFVDVATEVGKGTIFKICLPVHKQDETSFFDDSFDEIYIGEGTVLIIDDEAVIRQTAKTILEECGYTTILAENGQEGVDLFYKHQKNIDLVLLDMVMPKKSGRDVYLEIIKDFPDTKVILVSGFKRDERVLEVLEMGVNNFIQKPFTLGKLSKAVFEVISKNKIQQ